MNSRQVTRRTYDTSTSDSLTAVVVEAIAGHKEIDELDPGFLLYEEVNIESIDGLMNSDSPSNLQIKFECKDTTVCVQQQTETEFRITVTDSEREG